MSTCVDSRRRRGSKQDPPLSIFAGVLFVSIAFHCPSSRSSAGSFRFGTSAPTRRLACRPEGRRASPKAACRPEGRHLRFRPLRPESRVGRPLQSEDRSGVRSSVRLPRSPLLRGAASIELSLDLRRSGELRCSRWSFTPPLRRAASIKTWSGTDEVCLVFGRAEALPSTFRKPADLLLPVGLFPRFGFSVGLVPVARFSTFASPSDHQPVTE